MDPPGGYYIFLNWVACNIVQFQKISIPTLRSKGYWKFQGGGGSQKPKVLKESMKQNWNFQRGGGLKPKKTSEGGVWIFSGTTHSIIVEPLLFKVNMVTIHLTLWL